MMPARILSLRTARDGIWRPQGIMMSEQESELDDSRKELEVQQIPELEDDQ
jgi:hypothetical protein